ncbi:MAG TPA: hypothetical protein PLQ35_14950 [bacterium]|nr:hypothetical protein [bacterium]HQL63583.1 hypothetical protein [bacterium]
MRAVSHRSGIEKDLYQDLLWEEDCPVRPEDTSKREAPPKANIQSNNAPSAELIEEAGKKLLRVARKVCAGYPPSKRGPYRVSFYGYNSLKSTIREQRAGVSIRISHLLLDAPEDVLGGVLHTLLSRFHGSPVPRDLCRAYDEFCRNPEVEERMRRLRRMAGKKIIVGTQGKCRDLDEVFNRVNRSFFRGRLRKPMLTWSPGDSRRTMGYYDEEFNIVVISSRLDSKRVPVFVLDYIMYHELLHIACPADKSGKRRQIHTNEFKRRERDFPEYERAVRWIGKYWS